VSHAGTLFPLAPRSSRAHSRQPVACRTSCASRPTGGGVLRMHAASPEDLYMSAHERLLLRATSGKPHGRRTSACSCATAVKRCCEPPLHVVCRMATVARCYTHEVLRSSFVLMLLSSPRTHDPASRISRDIPLAAVLFRRVQLVLRVRHGRRPFEYCFRLLRQRARCCSCSICTNPSTSLVYRCSPFCCLQL
jgi:hypothetical protein